MKTYPLKNVAIMCQTTMKAVRGKCKELGLVIEDPMPLSTTMLLLIEFDQSVLANLIGNDMSQETVDMRVDLATAIIALIEGKKVARDNKDVIEGFCRLPDNVFFRDLAKIVRENTPRL